MNFRALAGSKFNEGVVGDLEEVAIFVDTVDALSNEHRYLGEDYEHCHRNEVPAGTEGTHQHVPVVLFAGVLDLVVTRYQQNFVLFCKLDVFHGDHGGGSSPGHSVVVLGLPGRRSSLRIVNASAGIGRKVIEAVDVHYKMIFCGGAEKVEKRSELSKSNLIVVIC